MRVAILLVAGLSAVLLLSGCSLERIGLAAAGWERVSEPTEQRRSAKLDTAVPATLIGPTRPGERRIAQGEYRVVDVTEDLVACERAQWVGGEVEWVPVVCVTGGGR